jgi:hypothetical protein
METKYERYYRRRVALSHLHHLLHLLPQETVVFIRKKAALWVTHAAAQKKLATNNRRVMEDMARHTTASGPTRAALWHSNL